MPNPTPSPKSDPDPARVTLVPHHRHLALTLTLTLTLTLILILTLILTLTLIVTLTPTLTRHGGLPQVSTGRDVMIDTPSELSAEQLEELQLRIAPAAAGSGAPNGDVGVAARA